MSRIALLCGALALLAGAVAAPPARAEDRAEVAAAMEEQDRLLEEAQRGGTATHVVARYQSRLERRPSALNHYLLGRALFYGGKDLDAAEKQLRRALELDPAFGRAHHGLCILALEKKDYAGARRHLDALERWNPAEADNDRLRAMLALRTHDWDGAIAVLRRLAERDASDESVRATLAEALAQKGDWEAALGELGPLRARHPQDVRIRRLHGIALFETGKLDAAIPELEALARVDPKDLVALDMLRLIYVRKEDRAGLIRTFERMIPLLKDEDRERMEGALEELRRGAPLRPTETPPAPVDPLPEILKRSEDASNVQTRREGLRDLYGVLTGRYEGAPPTVAIPGGILGRIHQDVEPDAVCRGWVMRLLGKAGAAGHPGLAIYAGYALFDRDPDVRRLAAEALGEIGTPAAVVYLRAFLFRTPFGTEATDADVKTFNATRLALVALTGHSDVPAASTTWVERPGQEAAREEWAAWFRSPEGSVALRKAIEDVDRLGEIFPERHLVELMNEPSFEVSRAAYVVLRKRSMGPPEGVEERAVEKKWWPRFPRLSDEDLTPESLPGLQQAVNEWWAGLRTERG